MIRGAAHVITTEAFQTGDTLNPNNNACAQGSWSTADGAQLVIPMGPGANVTAYPVKYTPVIDWIHVNFQVTGAGDIHAGVIWVDPSSAIRGPLIRRSYTSGDGCDTMFMEFNNGYPLLKTNGNHVDQDVTAVFLNLNAAVTGDETSTGPFLVGTGAELHKFQIGYHYEDVAMLRNTYGPR